MKSVYVVEWADFSDGLHDEWEEQPFASQQEGEAFALGKLQSGYAVQAGYSWQSREQTS